MEKDQEAGARDRIIAPGGGLVYIEERWVMYMKTLY